jgi:hypothetical protein
MSYVSSIVSKYGDTDNVKADARTLADIINRQGTSLLLDAIAEHVGTSAIRFGLTSTAVDTVINSLVTELTSAIKERT